jgi:hypothetical protein
MKRLIAKKKLYKSGESYKQLNTKTSRISNKIQPKEDHTKTYYNQTIKNQR